MKIQTQNSIHHHLVQRSNHRKAYEALKKKDNKLRRKPLATGQRALMMQEIEE